MLAKCVTVPKGTDMEKFMLTKENLIEDAKAASEAFVLETKDGDLYFLDLLRRGKSGNNHVMSSMEFPTSRFISFSHYNDHMYHNEDPNKDIVKVYKTTWTNIISLHSDDNAQDLIFFKKFNVVEYAKAIDEIKVSQAMIEELIKNQFEGKYLKVKFPKIVLSDMEL
jgi:hypothetical protein